MSLRIAALAGAASLFAASAVGQLSDPYITFNVANSAGSGSLIINLSDPRIVPQPDGGVVSNSFIPAAPAFPLTINDQTGSPIATIESIIAPATVDDIQTPGVTDARVGLTFVIRAASLDISVDVTSTFAQTDPISNAILRANAGYTISDTGGGGASLSGTGSLTRFVYNGDMNTGTLVSDLLAGPLSTGNLGSNSISDSSGDVALGTTVNSLQFQSRFTLTANDSASGNFSLTAVPAPASAALLGLGGLAAMRRRR